MSNEFRDIIIIDKPEPEQVSRQEKEYKYIKVYVFPFILSSEPPLWWQALFYRIWSGEDISQESKNENLLDYFLKPADQNPINDDEFEPIVEFQKNQLTLVSVLSKVAEEYKHLVEVITSTNREYKEQLQRQERKDLEERRAIQEALDKIELFES